MPGNFPSTNPKAKRMPKRKKRRFYVKNANKEELIILVHTKTYIDIHFRISLKHKRPRHRGALKRNPKVNNRISFDHNPQCIYHRVLLEDMTLGWTISVPKRLNPQYVVELSAFQVLLLRKARVATVLARA